MEQKMFASVRSALNKMDDVFTKLSREGYDALTGEEKALTLAPMNYLASIIHAETFYGEDLMYSLMAIYQPYKKVLGGKD